jgi:hypothetical protein
MRLVHWRFHFPSNVARPVVEMHLKLVHMLMYCEMPGCPFMLELPKIHRQHGLIKNNCFPGEVAICMYRKKVFSNYPLYTS